MRDCDEILFHYDLDAPLTTINKSMLFSSREGRAAAEVIHGSPVVGLHGFCFFSFHRQLAQFVAKGVMSRCGDDEPVTVTAWMHRAPSYRLLLGAVRRAKGTGS